MYPKIIRFSFARAICNLPSNFWELERRKKISSCFSFSPKSELIRKGLKHTEYDKNTPWPTSTSSQSLHPAGLSLWTQCPWSRWSSVVSYQPAPSVLCAASRCPPLAVLRRPLVLWWMDGSLMTGSRGLRARSAAYLLLCLAWKSYTNVLQNYIHKKTNLQLNLFGSVTSPTLSAVALYVTLILI